MVDKKQQTLEELLMNECNSEVWLPNDVPKIEAAFKQWIEQKDIKLTYLTKTEMEMSPEDVNLQIVLGLQSCKTKKDVCELLEDLRQHERHEILKRLEEKGKV